MTMTTGQPDRPFEILECIWLDDAHVVLTWAWEPNGAPTDTHATIEVVRSGYSDDYHVNCDAPREVEEHLEQEAIGRAPDRSHEDEDEGNED